MKKIFNTLVVLCVVLFGSAVIACTQNSAEVITGGACSIKELKNLEKNTTARKGIKFLPFTERNLRPVKTLPVMEKSNNDECLFGMCLYRRILEIESR